MEWLWLVGRAWFGLYLIMSGVNHFTKYKGMAQFAAYKNVPAPGLGVIASGVVLAGSGLSILTGYLVQAALIALAVFLIAAAVLFHNYWTVEDANAKMGEMNQFMKNIAIAAAALMMLAIPDWSWTL